MRAHNDIIGKVRRARVACVLLGVSLFGAAGVSAQDIGGVIALPDAPFVIPVPDRTYTFKDYRSDDVLTQRNDNNRTGASYVRGLNQESVRGFRKLGEFLVKDVDVEDVGVDNYPKDAIWAQPLYISAATVNDKRQPVLIVATANNSVYAFSPGNPSAAPLWHKKLGARFKGKKVEGALCEDGPVGIEATPVIDLEHNQVLVSYKTADAKQHLAALDLNHGDFLPPVYISGAGRLWPVLHRQRASLLLADGVVYVAFAGLCESPEAAHLLFHGSIFAFDAQTLEQVGFFPVTDDTDGGGIWQGSTGIAADTIGNLYFATGNRRLIDSEKPTFDHPTYSNSVIRLKVEKIGPHNRPPRPGEPYRLSMEVGDYFTPYRKIWQDYNDMDLGSVGVLLIPRTRYLTVGGKEGMIYVLDRANMGRWDDFDDEWHYDKVKIIMDTTPSVPAIPDNPLRDNAHKKFLAAVNRYQNDDNRLIKDANQVKMNDWLAWPHIHGTPVFARFDDQGFMFVWPEKDRPKQYKWRDEAFDPKPLEGDVLAPPVPLPKNNTFPKMDNDGNFVKDKDGNYIPETDENGPLINYIGSGMPGGMLSVNVDLSRPNSGVVFGSAQECRHADDPIHPKHSQFECVDQLYGALHAFDPITMKEIWNNCPGVGPGPHKCEDTRAGPDDYRFAKFVPPTIAAGRVFLSTASGKVIVYGLE